MDEEYIYVFGGLDNGTVYNADYEKQEGVRVKPETLVRVLKKMSEFLK
jgi:hypothetical protein